MRYGSPLFVLQPADGASEPQDMYSEIKRVDELRAEPEKLRRWREDQKTLLEQKGERHGREDQKALLEQKGERHGREDQKALLEQKGERHGRQDQKALLEQKGGRHMVPLRMWSP